MQERLIHEDAGGKTFALVFATGDEALEGLTRFAREHDLSAAQFTGIGAFSDVVLGYFDWETKDYVRIPVDEQVEVLSLVGDVASQDGEPAVHAHVVVGGRDGSARGGHLLAAHVRPTLEIVVSESPAHLRKRHDPESGLALIALDATDGPSGAPQGEAGLPHVPEENANVAGEQAQRVVEAESGTPRGASEEGGGLEQR
jgi:predicted DNA-binding protein with PD1-like motif